MDGIVLRSQKRVLIDTAGKWRQLVLPPQRWGLGSPVTALASRWTTSSVPEVDALLQSKKATHEFVFEEAWIEPGEKLELIVIGNAAGGRTLLVPVGLADEPLGPTVEEALPESPEPPRGLPPIVEQQTQLVFGVPPDVIGNLRMRLVTACARALQEARARACKQAVLIFHELRSPTAPRQLAVDQLQAIDEFVRRLSHGATRATTLGQLAGPVPPSTKELALFIGRASVDAVQ